MKQKKIFTALDVRAMVNCLKEKICGLRVANIFDINSKTYLFKFSKHDVKECLLIESGIRFHLTTAKIEKSKIPSAFTMKFRKFLRSKQLTNIEQIGLERVVDFTFGAGENCYHLLIELYAHGNIIVTDKDYIILQLLRSHEFTPDAKTSMNKKYPFEFAAGISIDKFNTNKEILQDLIQIKEKKEEEVEQKQDEEIKQTDNKGGKQKKKKQNQPQKQTQPQFKKFKELLFKLVPCFHPIQIEHFLKINQIQPNSKCTLQDIEILKQIADQAIEFLKTFCTQSHHPGSLLIMDSSKLNLNNAQNEQKEEQEEKKEQQLKENYYDFTPFLFQHQQQAQIKHFDNFCDAVDCYFSQIEVIIEPNQGQQSKAWKRYENIKEDQEQRISKLKQDQESFLVKADLIEQNIQEIDAVINIIQTMQKSGLNWEQISKMINDSKKNGDPLANIIHQINWQKTEVTLLIGPEKYENQTDELMLVEINFNLTAFQNAQNYYLNKKIYSEKEKRTIEATSYALKNAEKQAKSKQTENKTKIDVLNARKIFWFEKFYWFISSENYLILSGRDQQQNELLVKKYMGKDDLYMHADYHGASSTILKNPTPSIPVGRITLQEAAQFAVARSKAWDSKILADAWWVYAHQVSKSAPTGEYLPSGSFMIRGKKNLVHPMRMEMGFTLLFKIDEQCLEKHIGERKPKYLEEQEARNEEIKEEIAQTKEQLQQQLELRKQITEAEDNEITMVNLSNQVPRIREFDKQKQQQNKKQQEKKKDKQQQQQQVSQKQEDEEMSAKQEKKLTERQKKKLKKIQDKYGEQDEDEREIMMQLIGSKPIQLNQQAPEIIEEKECKQKKGKKKQSKHQQKQQKKQEKAAKFDELFNKLVETKQKDKPELKKEDEIQEKEEIIQEQKEETKEKIIEEQKEKTEETNDNPDKNEQPQQEVDSEEEEKQQEQLQQREEEEKIKQAEEELKEAEQSNIKFEYQKNEIDMLVGTLYSDDQYYFCIPMCGPYSSMINNKFKVKLTPGNLKKGKAAKTSLSLFLGQKDCDAVQRKLMKGLSDLDLVNNIVGNAKVVAPGIQKIKDKEKQNKKQQKREQFEKQKQKLN